MSATEQATWRGTPTDGSTPAGSTPTRPRQSRWPGPLRLAWNWLPTGRSLPLSDWRARHRWLVVLLWAHVFALPLFALYRGYSLSHSVLEGAVLGLFAAAATYTGWSPRWRAASAAVGLVSSSAVLVHFSGGFIEAHFHFFVVILLLALYEDWIPFLIALGYVVVHHGLAGQFSPEIVYNHADAVANPWKWALVHGAFVAAAATGAVISWRLNENARESAGHAMAHAVRSQEANELKNKFIATTSHELRTPLTSIIGFATTLTHRWDQVEDADKFQLLQIIEAQSSRLRHLIEDLLLLSATDSGKLPVRQSSVDVAAALDRIVSELHAEHDVSVDVPPGLTALVDERHFAQIVGNFVSNARKYGAPPVTVSASKVDGRIEVVVADQGDGVPESFVPQLFDAFSRADDDTAVHGTGLGLSIVRGLAEANGGDASYEPNHPRGARFKVRVPRADAASE